MQSITKWYMRFTGVLGMAVCAYSVRHIFFSNAYSWTTREVTTFVALLLLCWACYCLPLYLRDDCTVDLSFISVLASVLSMGPEVAIVITLIAYPLSVIPTPDGEERIHVFNTAPIKTAFNISSRSISYAVGGLAYYAVGGMPGNIELPGVLLPAALYILISMLANVVIIFIYYALTQSVRLFPAIFQLFWGLIPSIVCSAPIGYFLSMLLIMKNGAWLALLFMLPVLLARYSFKLFLDGQKQQYSIVKAIATALEAKDTYTQGHSSRVADYSTEIARKMGMSEKSIRRIHDAAVFHDVGKIGVPDAILQKPGQLTDEEWVVIKQHSQMGVDILKSIDAYRDLLPLVLHHHEHYDGRGYPSGTKGDEVSIEVYILGVADAFDAITSDRPYRKGADTMRVAKILREEAGKQFHPDVAVLVADMCEKGEMTIIMDSEQELEGTAC